MHYVRLGRKMALPCRNCLRLPVLNVFFLITGRLTEVGGAVREMVGSGQCLQAEPLRYLPWFGRRLCVMHFGLPAKPEQGWKLQRAPCKPLLFSLALTR